METDRDSALREQGGGAVRLNCVGVVNAEDEVCLAVDQSLTVLAGPHTDRVLVGTDDRLGPEVARAQAVGAADDEGNLVGRQWTDSVVVTLVVRLDPLGQRGPDLPGERVVCRQWLVSAFEDDDSLLSCQCFHHRRFREGTQNVDVDRPDRGVVIVPQIVDRSLDVLRRRPK